MESVLFDVIQSPFMNNSELIDLVSQGWEVVHVGENRRGGTDTSQYYGHEVILRRRKEEYGIDN